MIHGSVLNLLAFDPTRGYRVGLWHARWGKEYQGK